MENLDLSYQRALDHLSRFGFKSLDSLDRDIVTVWNWSAAVNNGGFLYLYRSKEGDTAFHAPQAFRRIGAMRTAEIAEHANSQFGHSGPSTSRAERVSFLASVSAASKTRWEELERELLALDEDCDELLEQFIKSTR